jgi:hypothetical protein
LPPGLAPGVGFSGALLSAQRVVEELHTISNASGIGWMPRKLKALRRS